MGLLNWILDWLRYLFWQQEMEVTLIGLQGAGKSTLLSVLCEGKPLNNNNNINNDTIPTIGLNTRKITRGNVTLKVWDLGGQPRFRNMWERYCRGVQTLIFVIDASEVTTFPEARQCLHECLSRPCLANIPLLILANKSDVAAACGPEVVVRALQLSKLAIEREVACYGVSAKYNNNLEVVLKWLVRHAKPVSSV